MRLQDELLVCQGEALPDGQEELIAWRQLPALHPSAVGGPEVAQDDTRIRIREHGVLTADPRVSEDSQRIVRATAQAHV